MERTHLVAVVEWSVSTQQCVRNDTEAPHVNRLSVPATKQNFWGHIAAERQQTAPIPRSEVGTQEKTEARGLMAYLGVPHEVVIPPGSIGLAKPQSAILMMGSASGVAGVVRRMFSGCNTQNNTKQRHEQSHTSAGSVTQCNKMGHLQIAVHDVLGVTVGNATGQGAHHSLCLSFSVVILLARMSQDNTPQTKHSACSTFLMICSNSSPPVQSSVTICTMLAVRYTSSSRTMFL